MFLKNRLLNEGNQELRTVFQSPKQFCFYCKTLETKKKKISKKLCVSFETPFLFKSIKNYFYTIQHFCGKYAVYLAKFAYQVSTF